MARSNLQGSLGGTSGALVILNIRRECRRKKVRIEAIFER